jgi:hypothetical protein
MLLPIRTDVPAHFQRLHYRLDCGKEVSLEGCCITPSTLEALSGSKEVLRDRIIERLPQRARDHFPWGETNGVFVKPVLDGDLPPFAFMVHLICYEPVSTSELDNDMSSLIVCWLGDDIVTSLPELIDREISPVQWDKYAVDGSI